MERRLAAIVAADVVGYSRLIRADEEGTLLALRALREELIDPEIEKHRGRIVKLMGDGILVEFASVVDAVACSAEVQKGVAERNDGEPRIVFRVGVNLGDVIIDGDDIQGDGVNVAARLEALSEPGGMCISEAVYEQVRDRLDLTFESLGSQQVKNIDRAVQAWKWSAPGAEAATVIGADETLPVTSDKPSIAVLPFDNMSGDPEQLYFTDGITEDIITELSRFRSLEVVARNTMFVYRDQAVNVSEIGAKVGATYLLEGSLRKSGDRIRLTAQLIDVNTGKHVWADRYDRQLTDIFAVQDELVHAIVSTLAVRLTAADMERAKRKPTSSLAAYDLYLRALSLDQMYSASSARKARELAAQAVELDPGFAKAHTMLAGQIFTCAWFDGTPAEAYTIEALNAAKKGVELDPDDSFCIATLGTVHLIRREYELAERCFETALKRNPHDTWVLADFAWYLVSVGRSDEALEHLDSKEIFEPHPPNWVWETRGQALYSLKRYKEAKAVMERMSSKPFWVNGFLAACCGQLGEFQTAKTYWAEAQEASPGMDVTFFDKMGFYLNEADGDQWVEGLRKAGLVD